MLEMLKFYFELFCCDTVNICLCTRGFLGMARVYSVFVNLIGYRKAAPRNANLLQSRVMFFFFSAAECRNRDLG